METTHFHHVPTQPFSDDNQQNNKEPVSDVNQQNSKKPVSEPDETVYQMLFVAQQDGGEVLVVKPIRKAQWVSEKSVLWRLFWLGFVGGVALLLYFIISGYLMRLNQFLKN